MTIKLKDANYALHDIHRTLRQTGQTENSPYKPRTLTKEEQNHMQLVFIVLWSFFDGLFESQ